MKKSQSHTPEDCSKLPLNLVFVVDVNRGFEGIVPSRSGYEAAENLQKGAVCPIFSRLNAICNIKYSESNIGEYLLLHNWKRRFMDKYMYICRERVHSSSPNSDDLASSSNFFDSELAQISLNCNHFPRISCYLLDWKLITAKTLSNYRSPIKTAILYAVK